MKQALLTLILPTMAMTAVAMPIIAIGGLFHPATLAGAVARFVFSLS